MDAAGLELNYGNEVAELDAIEPLWNALQAHHTEISPQLGGRPARAPLDAWRVRRGKYEHWLADSDTFFVIAAVGGEPVGYAFVTIGPGYASWQTGERIAELETLSILPRHRGDGIGAALLDAVWARLAELGVAEMAITATATNVDSHRFYERHGFQPLFTVFYGRAPR